MHILKQIKKIHFFQKVSNFQVAFLKDLLIKVVVAGTKVKYFKNQRPESKIGLLEASKIGLKLSDPKGIDHNLKIQKAFRF